MPDDLTRWRRTAELDARAGAPVGAALNEAADEVERLRAVLAGDVLGQIAEVEAKRAAMPDDERQRVEAADAPLLRLQLAGWYKQAKEAEAELERLRRQIVDDEVDLDDVMASLDDPADTTGETR